MCSDVSILKMFGGGESKVASEGTPSPRVRGEETHRNNTEEGLKQPDHKNPTALIFGLSEQRENQ